MRLCRTLIFKSSHNLVLFRLELTWATLLPTVFWKEKITLYNGQKPFVFECYVLRDACILSTDKTRGIFIKKNKK